MRRGERIKNACSALFRGTRFGNAFDAYFNRYEAAMPSTPRRPWVPSFVRDARVDANSFNRWEMTRKIRDAEANLWIMKRLKSVHQKYTVGPNGMPVIPASEIDHDWNNRALEAYGEWCDQPGLDSLLSMGQIHRLIAGETHIDGEHFILKTRRKVKGSQSIPAVQLVESHRVSTPGSSFSTEENKEVVDGCQIDSSGRTIGFWIKDGFAGDVWSYRDANQVIHTGMPDRAGMYRYITPYHATLNTLQDLWQLEEFEMQRAKANSEDAKILETPSGELPRSMLQREAYMNISGIGTPPNPATLPTSDLQAQLEQYRVILGSRMIALPSGTKMITPTNPSPSTAQQWFWRLKMEQIAAGVNIPMLLVIPDSIQGTVARAILDDAHLHFRSWFNLVYAPAAREMYRYFMSWAIYNDKRVQDPPADWSKCNVIPPRACNVDVGRNSIATLAEYDAGTLSLDDIAGANGTTAEVLLQKKARNVGRTKQIAQEVGAAMGVEIDPAEICAPLADIVQKLSASELGGGGEKDPEDKKETVND